MADIDGTENANPEKVNCENANGPAPTDGPQVDSDDIEARLAALEQAERAIDTAFTTGKAERARITKLAQLDAAEAVAMAGIAMESDAVADEAMRITIILEGVAFWLFINRYKIARPFVIGMSIFGVVFPTITNLVLGTLTPWTFFMDTWFFIFLIVYFSTSKRVKATLVNDFSKRKGDFDHQYFIMDRRGWPFIRNLIISFIVFSVLGHWMEMAMCQLIRLGLVQGEYDPTNTMLWRDWLYPFPMEGMAVVLIALFLYPLWEYLQKKITIPVVPYVISFVVNALICSAIEFTMGLFVNADLQLWDYTENFGNIMGQVCLQNALAFGAAASIITWWVYPLVAKLIARVPRDIMNIVFVVILVFGCILWSLYIITPPQEVVDSASNFLNGSSDIEIVMQE